MPEDYIHSKIIFIHLKNFAQIHSIKEFKKETKCNVLDKYIVVQGENKVYIYDINKLVLIKIINYVFNNFLYKCYNNFLIAVPLFEKENDLLVFKIEENEFIHTLTIKTEFKSNEKHINDDRVINYNNKILFILKDKRILILCHGCIYVINFDVE